MSHRYYKYKKKKENIIGNSPPLHHEHYPQPKYFADMVRIS